MKRIKKDKGIEGQKNRQTQWENQRQVEETEKEKESERHNDRYRKTHVLKSFSLDIDNLSKVVLHIVLNPFEMQWMVNYSERLTVQLAEISFLVIY